MGCIFDFCLEITRIFQFKMARDNLKHSKFPAGSTAPILLQCPSAAVAVTCQAAPKDAIDALDALNAVRLWAAPRISDSTSAQTPSGAFLVSEKPRKLVWGGWCPC